MILFEGCGNSQTPYAVDIGTTAMVQLPDGDPPVLTKELANRIHVGMSQREVLTMIRNAGRHIRSAKSLLELAYDQSMVNPIRYNLTMVQGRRKFALEFKSEKLEKKAVYELD